MRSIFGKTEKKKDLEYFEIYSKKTMLGRPIDGEKVLKGFYNDLPKYTLEEKLTFFESRLRFHNNSKKSSIPCTGKIDLELDYLLEFASPYTSIWEKKFALKRFGVVEILMLDDFDRLLPLFKEYFGHAPSKFMMNLIRTEYVRGINHKTSDPISAHWYFGTAKSDEEIAVAALQMMGAKDASDATEGNIKVLPMIMALLKSGKSVEEIKRCFAIVGVHKMKEFDYDDVEAVKLLLGQDPEVLDGIERISSRYQEAMDARAHSFEVKGVKEYNDGAIKALNGLRRQNLSHPFIFCTVNPLTAVGALVRGMQAGFIDMRGIILQKVLNLNPNLGDSYEKHKTLTEYLYLSGVTPVQIAARKVVTPGNGNFFGHLDIFPLRMLNIASLPDDALIHRMTSDAEVLREKFEEVSLYVQRNSSSLAPGVSHHNLDSTVLKREKKNNIRKAALSCLVELRKLVEQGEVSSLQDSVESQNSHPIIRLTSKNGYAYLYHPHNSLMNDIRTLYSLKQDKKASKVVISELEEEISNKKFDLARSCLEFVIKHINEYLENIGSKNLSKKGSKLINDLNLFLKGENLNDLKSFMNESHISVIAHRLRETLDSVKLYAHIIGYTELESKLENLPNHAFTEQYISSLREIIRECRYLIESNTMGQDIDRRRNKTMQEILVAELKTKLSNDTSLKEEEKANIGSQIDQAERKIKELSVLPTPPASYPLFVHDGLPVVDAKQKEEPIVEDAKVVGVNKSYAATSNPMFNTSTDGYVTVTATLSDEEKNSSPIAEKISGYVPQEDLSLLKSRLQGLVTDVNGKQAEDTSCSYNASMFSPASQVRSNSAESKQENKSEAEFSVLQ